MTVLPTEQRVFVEPKAAPAARTVEATKVYGADQTEVRALDGVTVEFARGGFTAIMGPSGSGKSTLLQCTAGLDTLTSGQAFIGDTDLSALSDHALTILRRDHIGFVFQSYNLVTTLTAEENIRLPLLLAGKEGDGAWIDKVVNTLGIADRLRHASTASPTSGRLLATSVARDGRHRPMAETRRRPRPVGAP